MKKKRRIIIDIEDGISPSVATAHVGMTIHQGRISENTAGVKHYCWLTAFTNGLVVSVRRKRTPDAADSFRVYREKP